MEPERRDTYTHIERDRERRGGSGMAFVIGGLVVAVAVIALVVWGGDFGGGGGELSTQGQLPVIEAPAGDAPAEVEVEVESQTILPAPAGDAAPVENQAEPIAPAAPVQQ